MVFSPKRTLAFPLKEPIIRLRDTRAKEVRTFTLSNEQAVYWRILQEKKGDGLLNMASVNRWIGLLDVSVLQRCVDELLCRYAILRTGFSNVEGELKQVVSPHVELPLVVIDCSEAKPNEQTVATQCFAKTEAARTFDFEQAPLLRVSILQLSRADDITVDDIEAVLVISIHHLIADYVSLNIIIKELTQLYEAFSQDLPSPLLSADSFQFSDFIAGNQTQTDKNRYQKEQTYWRKQLANMSSAATLPYDNTNNRAAPCQPTRIPFRVESDLYATLRQFCRDTHMPLFVVLLTVLKVMIYQTSGQQDVAIGAANLGRDRPETQNMIGPLAQSIVLRSQIRKAQSFIDLLTDTRRVVLHGYAHSRFPYPSQANDRQEVLRSVMVESPYRILTSFFSQRARESFLTQSEQHPAEMFVDYCTDLDLYFSILEKADGLEGMWIYNRALFKPETVDAYMTHYYDLLCKCICSPERSVSSIYN